MRKFVSACSLLAIWPAICNALPPVTGPLLPQPSHLQKSEAFQAATQNITAIFERTTNGNDSLSQFFRNVSFSVAVTSYAAAEDSPVLWDHHHLAFERNGNGTSTISGSSQYMIASISKVFTDLLVLKSKISLDASIVEYLPELKSARNRIAWQDVTILDLMSHLSGIPQNYGFPEIYQTIPIYQQLGFPPVSESDFPSCGVIGLNSGCDAAQLVTGMTSASLSAVAEPRYAAAYNNLAFSLLGIILERQTNQTFADLIQSQITGPLKMKGSGVSPGNTSAAVIPTGDSSWEADFGVNAPAGGMYSTTDDLSRFARSILSKPADVNAWLKPRAFLPGLGQSVGVPWEIYRTDRLLANQTIDIYAKDGGVVGYSSRLTLLPQFGVGISCLTAGSVSGPDLILETVFSILVPALNEAAKEEAKAAYAGTWTSMDDTVETNMTTATDSSGVGLQITGLFRNGSDILTAINEIYTAGVVVASQLNTDWRAYPTGVRHKDTVINPAGEEVRVILEDWRLGFESIRFQPDHDSELNRYNRHIFEHSVASWQGLDSMYYGGQAVDRLVALRSQETDDILGWNVPSLRADLWKS